MRKVPRLRNGRWPLIALLVLLAVLVIGYAVRAANDDPPRRPPAPSETGSALSIIRVGPGR